jgi:8-oxo-dGTP diphosphatase
VSTWQSTGIAYSVEVSSDASADQVAQPLEVVDQVAEIPQAIRAGAVAPSRRRDTSPKAQIVTALLRDGHRVLLCHRSPRRRWYPDVWDLPGGHVEPGELPAAALARELREELGIDIAAPLGPPMQKVRADTFEMQIWLIEAWIGSPINLAPDEHDAIAWFTEDALSELSLAHDSYLEMFTKALASRRT